MTIILVKFVKRCDEKYLNDEFVDEKPSKKRFRESEGGRKCKAPEVRKAMVTNVLFVTNALDGSEDYIMSYLHLLEMKW